MVNVTKMEPVGGAVVGGAVVGAVPGYAGGGHVTSLVSSGWLNLPVVRDRIPEL